MSALAAFCKLYVDRGFQSAAEACDALERHPEVYMASCKTVGEGNFEKVDVFNTRGCTGAHWRRTRERAMQARALMPRAGAVVGRISHSLLTPDSASAI
jgi:hypothetical protein